jgi:hypothetical protein
MSFFCVPPDGCGASFGGLAGFDRHRVGVHAYTLSEGLCMNPPREDGRRCLSHDEISALGWHQTDGVWKLPVKGAGPQTRQH